MILEITTQNQDLIKAIKAMAKLTDAKVKTRQIREIPAWLKEAKNMEKNPQQYKSYTDIDEMFKDILR